MKPSEYYKGRTARISDRNKNTNPFRPMTNAWSWWMAGWNDRDMEVNRAIQLTN